MTSRTRLDWLVYSSIWDRLKTHVQNENAEIDGYLSRAVETAMREAIDEHRYSPVEEKVRRLVDLVDAKKRDEDTATFSPTEYSGKTRATVWVDAELLAEYKSHVDEASEYSYGVALSQHLEYYLQGGRPDSLASQLDRVADELEREADTSLSTTEEIADRLDTPFSREEFLTAAEAAGVGTKKYALSEYLPKVLDEMDVYPLPNNPDRFVPTHYEPIPETPDPSALPYHAMDEAEKRLVLKVGALRKARDHSRDRVKFTATDAVDALGGRPRHSTVRPLLRDIADEMDGNGFSYDEEDGLLVDERGARTATFENEDALAILGWLDDDTEPADDSHETSDQFEADETTDPESPEPVDWVTATADRLQDKPPDVPDVVVDNAIARAKQPEAVDDVTDEVDSAALDAVTVDERERVKEQLGWLDDTDEERTVADEMDQLTEAQPVHAD